MYVTATNTLWAPAVTNKDEREYDVQNEEKLDIDSGRVVTEERTPLFSLVERSTRFARTSFQSES
jgi:hypothetical protein